MKRKKRVEKGEGGCCAGERDVGGQRLVWTDREKRVTYEGEGRGVLRVKREENDEKCVGVVYAVCIRTKMTLTTTF